MDFLLLFILAGVGITSIVVDSEFFAGWKDDFGKAIKARTDKLGDDLAPKDTILWLMRKVYYMLNCYQCSGFWVGLVLGALLHPLGDHCSHFWRIPEAILAGGAISYAAQTGMALYNYLNVQYGNKQE